jgi:DTW domain-containing protein YfiP
LLINPKLSSAKPRWRLTLESLSWHRLQQSFGVVQDGVNLPSMEQCPHVINTKKNSDFFFLLKEHFETLMKRYFAIKWQTIEKTLTFLETLA